MAETGSSGSENGGDNGGGVGEVGQDRMRARGGEFGWRGGAAGHAHRPRAGRARGLHVERRVADEYGQLAGKRPPVNAGGVVPRDPDKLGPHLVDVSVGADLEVEVAI